MAFTPTDPPTPLSPSALSDVPGVLGGISRERSEDYAHISVPAEVAAPNPDERFRSSFADALSTVGLSFIAEVKRGSPSQGAIADLDPGQAAQAYAAGGAAAISVLTEPRHFGGALAHLEKVTRLGLLPAMRKEFVVHPAQVAEAAQAGADAVLLIAAVLQEELGSYLRYAEAWGLAALVEVHDEQELDLALDVGSAIIGINNRDLTTLEIDLRVAPRLLRQARERGFKGLLVAESGYRSAEELRPVIGLADAVLVGTSLAGSGDLEAALRQLKSEVCTLESEGTA